MVIKAKAERTYHFGVFARPGKCKRWLLSAYSMWYSPEWKGFVGHYQITAGSRREAIKKAKAAAWRDLEGKYGK